MPRQTPEEISLVITPTFKSDRPIVEIVPPANLLEGAHEAHQGLRSITVRRLTRKDGKIRKQKIYRIDVKDPAPGKPPRFSPEMIASTCTAMAEDDATDREKRTTYQVVFWLCREPGAPKSKKVEVQFFTEPREASEQAEADEESEGGEEAAEGAEEEEAEGDGEDGDGEEGDGEDGDEEEEGDDDDEDEEEDDFVAPRLVGPPGAGQPWNPHAQPGDRHEALAPRIQHIPPEHMEAAFPPGAIAPQPTPAQLGAMTSQSQPGMEHYASMMHPAQSLFMHHLGGVFAETRATMREMRQDVREARTEAKAATERLIQLSTMGTQQFEAMMRSSQMGWDAMHHGQTMQLNALQNSLAWERRIMELQHGQQGGGAGMMFVQMLMALIPQAITAVAMWKGLPPDAAQALGGMVGGGMPGGMPGLPGAPPPGFAPPAAPPPMSNGHAGPPMGFAPPDAPPPGFNGHAGPPMGFAPPAAPPPGFASPDAPPPGFFNGHAAPPGGFAMPPAAPPEPVQFRPPSPPSPSPMGPGPFATIPPTGPLGTGPFGVMQQMPPAPLGAVPTAEAIRERFKQAPYCAMIEMLLLSTAHNGGQHRLIQAGCGHLVHSLQACHGAASDFDAKDRFLELARVLSTPGVAETAVQQLVGDDRMQLIDIRNVVCSLLAPPPIHHEPANAPSIGWSPTPMPPAAPMPPMQMRLVPDGAAPMMTIPAAAPTPSIAPSDAAPVLEVHVDDAAAVAVEPTSDAPAKMRTPQRAANKRKAKTPPTKPH